MPGVPPGLEYLTQVDQLLLHQAIELLEGTFRNIYGQELGRATIEALGKTMTPIVYKLIGYCFTF